MNFISILLLFGLGVWEIVLIALVILLLFGAKRIPELMKSLGKGVKNFKEGLTDVEKELKNGSDSNEKGEDSVNS